MASQLLCAVDDSPRAFEAVAVAGDLARRLDLQLALGHVVDEPPGFPFGEPAVMEPERRARREAGEALVRGLAQTMGLAAETDLRVESGAAAETLANLAEELSAELVVVGSRGRGRMRSALFGSVSGDLVESVSCPLVVVPPGAAQQYGAALAADHRTIVCGVEASAAADRAIACADRLAGALRARLHVTHVAEAAAYAPVGYAGAPFPLAGAMAQQEEAAQELLERAAENVDEESAVELTFEHGDPAQSLERAAGEGWAQLVVVPDELSWQRLTGCSGPPVVVVPGPRRTRWPQPQ